MLIDYLGQDHLEQFPLNTVFQTHCSIHREQRFILLNILPGICYTSELHYHRTINLDYLKDNIVTLHSAILYNHVYYYFAKGKSSGDS